MTVDLDQYATIADQYAHMRGEVAANSLQNIERHVLGDLLGDLRGSCILDLASGPGVYAREYESKGAARVLGVDYSQAMIEQARHSAEQSGARCLEFRQGDARSFRTDETFDVVTVLYLLNHARDEDELRLMLATAYAALKPGGRLVGINNRFEQHPRSFASLEKYGIRKQLLGPAADGTPVEMTLVTADGPITFTDYYCSQGTLERGMLTVGFDRVQWFLPYLPPEEKGHAVFWRDFLVDPSHHYFHAVKPG